MAHIKINKGLDIPIKGKPRGEVGQLIPSGGSAPAQPEQVALDLTPFEETKFKLLVKPEEVVKIGQPIAEDKFCLGRMFCSPGGGSIREIRRGPKRRLFEVVIDLAKKEEYHEHPPLDIERASRREIIDALKTGGSFAHIRSRPFNLLADPNKAPRNIFVKAIESAPFMPPAELQVAGHEGEFQAGLSAIKKLTDGHVHLFYKLHSPSKAFSEARDAVKHTVEGPHPVGTHSLFINSIDPIRSPDDVVWILNAHDLVAIGSLLLKGRCFIDRIISVAGPGISPGRIGYFLARAGMPISSLASGRIEQGPLRLISGDPLMGRKVGIDDFLGFYHYVFCAIPENTEREFLHFFRLGFDKYSFSRAYASGHFDNRNREYEFTTSQHGEHRAFIDSSLYDEVMPLPFPTMLLVKAVMAEDYELAQQLGLLNVDSEDFALPAFVCPSKMEMTEIIKQGLKRFAYDLLN